MRGGARRPRALAEPLAAAFFATATAAGRAAAERERRSLRIKKGVPSETASHASRALDDARFDAHLDFCDVSFFSEDAKPSPDDIAAAVEATALLRLRTVDKEQIRAAVSAR